MSAGERSALPVLGRWALVAALAFAFLTAWINNPGADGSYALGRANSLLRDGYYSQAASLLENTLKTYQGPQVRLSLSYVYLARRDAVRAERQVRIALPSASPTLRLFLLAQLGRVLRFVGRPDEALAAWQQVENEALPYLDMAEVRAATRSSQWNIAMLLWARGDWDAARAGLESLLDGDDVYSLSARVKLAQLLAFSDSDSSARLEDEARSHLPLVGVGAAIPNLRVPGLEEGLANGEIESILATLDKARIEVAATAQRGVGDAVVQTLWGGAYLQMGENLLAKLYLQQAISLQPDYAPAHARLALALFTLGDEQAALAQVQTAVQLDGNDPLARHVLARIYTATGNWDQAEEQLQALNRLQPGGLETHLEWAEFYRLQGEYDQAESEYIEAVNAQIVASALPGITTDGVEEDTNAAVILARFYTDVRGFGCEKGLPAAREAVSLRPDDPAGLDAIGWALVICDQPQQALSSLKNAIARSPNEPRYHFHLAHAYRDLGMYDDARDQYNRVIDLDPGGSWEHLALTELVNLSQGE